MDLKGAKIRDFYHLGSDMNSEDESANIFRVPHFQRPYTWEENHISALIDDHSSNSIANGHCPYFAGAVVTAVENDHHSLIDGQQRFTTLYLANYLRFLIYRSYFAVAIDRRDYRARELAPHFEKTCRYAFREYDFFSSDWLRDCIDVVMEDAERCEEIKSDYLERMFMPELVHDAENYFKEHHLLLKQKIDNNDIALLLEYDRASFNEQLKDALSRAVIVLTSETGPDLSILRSNKKNSSVDKYLNAIECLFSNFFDKAKNVANETKWNSNSPYKAIKIIELIDRFIADLKFCVVQTGRKEDAYTLFEVLNDRALSLDDLDIAKNYFYKKYVLWSQSNQEESEPPEVIDKALDDMDELWGEQIFEGADYLKRLTSYLGVVYLSGSENLVSDRGEKLRSCIRDYLKDKETYSSSELRSDFKIFHMIKRLLVEVGLSGTLKEKRAIAAICDCNSSYIKKFLLLAHALNFEGIMPGIISPILKTLTSWNHTDFDENLTKIATHEGARNLASKEEELAYYLFNHLLASSNHKKTRKLVAEQIIRYIFAGSTTNIESFHMQQFRISDDLIEEFENWLLSWQYGQSAQGMRIRSLLTILLGSQLDTNNHLSSSAFLTIISDPDKLTLDHLEPLHPNRTTTEAFFEHDERQRIVNSLGNMMLLDSASNTAKSNNPMCTSLETLAGAGLRDHWLTKEIKKFLEENHTMISEKMVPNEDFFLERGKRLKSLMSSVLKKIYEA